MEAKAPLSRSAIDALADDIAETAAYLDAATHRLLVLIREFDLARGWDHQGALSCAHWLSWRIGLGLGPAREKVRVAHRLAELPLIDDALRRGELSFSKVRALTRVATPANEATLLDQARLTTASQLERICRFYRQARSLKGEDPRTLEDLRWVDTRPTDDGMVSIQIRLFPEEAACLLRALQLAAGGASLADGAVALAELALSGAARAPLAPQNESQALDPIPHEQSGRDSRAETAGSDRGAEATGSDPGAEASGSDPGADASGSDPGADASGRDSVPAAVSQDSAPERPGRDSARVQAGSDSIQPSRRSSGQPSRQRPRQSPGRPSRPSLGLAAHGPPVEVVIHVDAATLEGRTESGDGLSAETCRRLLCDAGVVPLVEDSAGRTIDVGRKSRTIPSALRRALRARDRGCRFPGCTHVRFLDAHHCQHWLDGGETKLSNTALLCRRHHRYVHEFGFSLALRDGEPVFFDPHGRELPASAPRTRLPDSSFDHLRSAIRRSGIEISAETNLSLWDGLPVDYDRCVTALMS